MAFDLTELASRAVGAAFDITTNISRGVEPQHAYRWEFVVHGILGGSEAIKFYAQTCSVPEQTKTPIRVDYCGATMHYQGKPETEKMLNVSFYDNQDLDIYKFIYLWYHLMNADTDYASVNPVNYMKRAEVRLLDTTESIITEQFIFLDLFPVRIGEVSLDYGNSEVMRFDVGFQFNHMNVGYGVLDAVGDAASAVNTVRSLF